MILKYCILRSSEYICVLIFRLASSRFLHFQQCKRFCMLDSIMSSCDCFPPLFLDNDNGRWVFQVPHFYPFPPGTENSCATRQMGQVGIVFKYPFKDSFDKFCQILSWLGVCGVCLSTVRRFIPQMQLSICLHTGSLQSLLLINKSFYAGSYTFFCIGFSLLKFLFDMFSDHIPTDSLHLRVAIKRIHGENKR